jgi:hypothetical protein
MPKGTGVDASVNDGAVAGKHKVQKRSTERKRMSNKENKPPKKTAIATAIEVGSPRESKLAALHMFLEFGSSAEKERAKRELQVMTYGTVDGYSDVPADEENAEDASCTSSEEESDSSSSVV